MTKPEKQKRLPWMILSVLTLLVISMAIAVFINLPKPVLLDNPALNLATIPDGTYTGSCENGLQSA